MTALTNRQLDKPLQAGTQRIKKAFTRIDYLYIAAHLME
jgi:hypothetical protein